MTKTHRPVRLVPMIAILCWLGSTLSWAATPAPKTPGLPSGKAPVVVITKPDLTLEQIQIFRMGGEAKETILKVAVTVRNKDNGENSRPLEKERIKVLLEWQGPEGLKSWESWVQPLKVGEAGEAVFTDCRIPAGQKGRFRATVDPRNQVDEWSEANNSGSLAYEDRP